MTRIKNNDNIFTGTIESIRAVEDCIRATKRYTEGLGTMRHQHPIQGEGFPSKKFRKWYEVSPHTEIKWDMPMGIAMDWLWHDVVLVDVIFEYDYRVNKASVQVINGKGALGELVKAIPGFREALKIVVTGNNGQKGGESDAVQVNSHKR